MGTSPHKGEVPTMDIGGDERPPNNPTKRPPATTLTASALLAPGALGSFRPDIANVECVAAPRAIGRLIAVNCGGDHPAVDALRHAEADATTSDQALAAFDAMPATKRRKILSVYIAVMSPSRLRGGD
ncbi:MAG TPA: hypothetical protein VKP67_09920 [Xanthobacteraceae bacterium]|nr:hypothetical protein [Xanthobacteraceae bacterium]